MRWKSATAGKQLQLLSTKILLPNGRAIDFGRLISRQVGVSSSESESGERYRYRAEIEIHCNCRFFKASSFRS